MTFYDETAERVVVACAIATSHGADLARARNITAASFYVPKFRRLYATIQYLPVSTWDRPAEAARIAREALSEVEDIVRARPVQFDTSGSYAKRVLADEERRKIAAQLAEVRDELDAGTDPHAIRRRLRLVRS